RAGSACRDWARAVRAVQPALAAPAASRADNRSLSTPAQSWPHLSFQRDLLHAPVGHLADEEDVLAAALDRVREAEFLRLLAGRAKPARHGSVEPHLIYSGIVHPVFVAGVRDEEVLRRTPRHAHRDRLADARELALERALGVEHLDAPVPRVRDIDVELPVDRDSFHTVELPG